MLFWSYLFLIVLQSTKYYAAAASHNVITQARNLGRELLTGGRIELTSSMYEIVGVKSRQRPGQASTAADVIVIPCGNEYENGAEIGDEMKSILGDKAQISSFEHPKQRNKSP